MKIIFVLFICEETYEDFCKQRTRKILNWEICASLEKTQRVFPFQSTTLLERFRASKGTQHYQCSHTHQLNSHQQSAHKEK